MKHKYLNEKDIIHREDCEITLFFDNSTKYFKSKWYYYSELYCSHHSDILRDLIGYFYFSIDYGMIVEILADGDEYVCVDVKVLDEYELEIYRLENETT